MWGKPERSARLVLSLKIWTKEKSGPPGTIIAAKSGLPLPNLFQVLQLRLQLAGQLANTLGVSKLGLRV